MLSGRGRAASNICFTTSGVIAASRADSTMSVCTTRVHPGLYSTSLLVRRAQWLFVSIFSFSFRTARSTSSLGAEWSRRRLRCAWRSFSCSLAWCRFSATRSSVSRSPAAGGFVSHVFHRIVLNSRPGSTRPPRPAAWPWVIGPEACGPVITTTALHLRLELIPSRTTLVANSACTSRHSWSCGQQDVCVHHARPSGLVLDQFAREKGTVALRVHLLLLVPHC